MASDSSKEQLAIVQMDALNTVCLQFADADKKCLKRKVAELKKGNYQRQKTVSRYENVF